MGDKLKLRWKILFIIIAIIIGLAGGAILEWWLDRKMRKKGYELECRWIKH